MQIFQKRNEQNTVKYGLRIGDSRIDNYSRVILENIPGRRQPDTAIVGIETVGDLL